MNLLQPDRPSILIVFTYYITTLFQVMQMRNKLSKTVNPSNSNACNNLGMTVLESGNPIDNVKVFENALQLNKRDALAWYHLGLTKLKNNELRSAQKAFNMVLSIDSGHVDARIQIADLARQEGRMNVAVGLMHEAKQLQPESALPCFLLARLYQESGQYEKAVVEYENTIAKDPTLLDAYMLMGVSLQALEHYDKALFYYKKSLSLKRNDPILLSVIGCLYIDMGQYANAIKALRFAHEISPHNHEILNNLAIALKRSGQFNKAYEFCKRAISLKPDFPAAYNNLGNICQQMKKIDIAENYYKQAISQKPDYAEAFFNLGILKREMELFDESLAAYQEALRIDPNFYRAWNNLGNLFMFLGNQAEAVKALERTIEVRPDCAEAYKQIVTIKKLNPSDRLVKKMKTMVTDPKMRKKNKMLLSFALGKVYEDAKDYPVAFRFMEAGNNMKRSEIQYNSLSDKKAIDCIKSTFNPQYIRKHSSSRIQDHTPIFILGMPRSGTSLVEQILSNHPDVHGAGELTLMDEIVRTHARHLTSTPFPGFFNEFESGTFSAVGEEYLRRIRTYSSASRHITDKMPGNFIYIGLIRLALPKAKIIHCKRNPMDTCLSIYKTLFSSPSIRWAYDLKELGDYYLNYKDIMDHWASTVPGEYMDINYEKLVEDPEMHISMLLGYLELEWNDRCLAFHKSSRAVFTASTAQVRKPIYTDSVERWRKYERQLEALQTMFLQGGIM